MKSNFWTRSEKFPPILVRLLARHRYGAPLTTDEIVSRSGLTYFHVECISQHTDWSACDLVSMRRFLSACGADWENQTDLSRMENYLRSKPTWKYLRVSPNWDGYYRPLLETFLHHLKRK